MNRVIIFFLLASSIAYSQDQQPTTSVSRKGSFYFYWGWNRDAYTKSDISFSGNDYNFTLDNVVAKDRQSPFDV